MKDRFAAFYSINLFDVPWLLQKNTTIQRIRKLFKSKKKTLLKQSIKCDFLGGIRRGEERQSKYINK